MPFQVLTQANYFSEERLQSLVSLMSRASGHSPYLYANDQAFFRRNLSGEANNVFVYDDKKMIGYAALRSMNPWPTYLDAQPYPPKQCAMMLINVVDPDYRGKGVGNLLMKARINVAKSEGMEHLFSTVHPDNAPSLRLLEKHGFNKIAQKEMFQEQLLRNLMYLNITQ
ncbi:MAG: GNAT family N-acetyltransferase [Pontibacterium sp.]